MQIQIAKRIVTAALAFTSLNARAETCSKALSAMQGLAKGWRNSWGERGFLSREPALTPETLKASLDLGLMWWDLPIFLMRDLESAHAHNASLDPLARGIYLLGYQVKSVSDFLSYPIAATFTRLDSNASLPMRRLRNQQITQAIFTDAARNGAFEFLPDGRVRHIPFKKLIRRVPPEHIGIAAPSRFFGEHAYFLLNGWVAPAQRGVLEYDAEFLRRRSVRRARQLGLELLKAGYKIGLAQDFASSLTLLANYQRYGFPSRYINSVYFKTTLDLHAAGRAFIFEIVSPTGQRLAGALGFLNHRWCRAIAFL